MPRKKKEETMEDVLEEMGKALKDGGENNFAIVIYSYLASRRIGLDGFFAKHCQDFCREQMQDVEKLLKMKSD